MYPFIISLPHSLSDKESKASRMELFSAIRVNPGIQRK